MPELTVLALLTLLAGGAPSGPGRVLADRRPRLERDVCSRRGLDCERRCDALRGAERLSCKTECRLAESRCRSRR